MSGVWFLISLPTEASELHDLKSKTGSTDEETKLCFRFSEAKGSTTKQSSLESKISSTGTFSTAHSVIGDTDAFVGEKIIDQSENIEILQRNSSQDSNFTVDTNEKDLKYDSDYLVDFIDKRLSMERLLEEVLEHLIITDAVWVLSQDKRTYQVSFPCDSGTRCDTVLRSLTSRGIGFHRGSTIGIIPCAIFYRESKVDELDDVASSLNSESQSDDECPKPDTKKEVRGIKALQRDFLKSITSRLTVAQVVEGVRANAALTFDFTLLIVFASIIAAIGLMESNSVILVASMLISPLMGPILAGTFGFVVQDRSLWTLGIRTELAGLTLCIVLGFIIGLIYTNISWHPESWPTSEMASRGYITSLIYGAFIALPSGGGVALSVLGGNIGSLVGVAISASLLPPAVNAGLLWGMAVILSKYSFLENNSKMETNATSEPFVEPPMTYSLIYSDTIAKECAILGVISLLLTVINIICIFIAAVAVLKIKEVAPTTNVLKTRRFWKQDIKIARDYNKTLRRNEAKTLGKQVLEEWAKLNGIDSKEEYRSHKAQLIQLRTLKSIVEDVEADGVYQTVLRSMPGGPVTEPLSRQLLTWPIPELSSPQSHPSLWDLGLQTGVEGPVENHIPHISATDKAKKYLRTRYVGFSFDSMSNYQPMDSVSEVDFQGRHHLTSSIASTAAASSYNNFLQVNRMGLWPPQGHFRGRPSRFVVTPVEEVESPSPQSRARHGNLPSNALDTVTTV